MNTFPMTKIGGIEVSRVTCGTNTFYGFSHFSAARDRWLRQHFTAERIMEVLEACRLEGINVTISSPNEGYYQILREHERQTGHHWVWMCTPGGKMWEEVVRRVEAKKMSVTATPGAAGVN